jgi:Ca-activated chloride channel family protein
MDLSDFHFLRPAWLLAILPALWLWWWLLKRRHPLGNWGQVMEERFARLFITNHQPPRRWPIHGLLMLWILSVIALAGPSWIQQPVPAHKIRTGVVIVFDLSLSMLAQDIKPSRLKRARYKVEDLVKHHPDQRFGLVAYAGSAHVITPLAEDSATLLNLLPSLNPMIMPKLGSRPDGRLSR